ncbi:carbonic anhydrase [Roseobacter sp. HKCCD9010]|jgi:carbonic anhydrase|uniref:carbonic anhydrase n=1 Tax=Rhodobacterales TaxID=204455 RepID=UPI00119B5864|nr:MULTISPECIES: carbonic anhydrase [Rhodobacterales]MBF9048532.1 carbonic anhydrase [Rhodobacterales bacterium HKCCD4356]NNV10531.1 carbonic anhydrase [Roseobacter sp. HKCCD7357]NNV14716.1 carbonic anhydrase [Roseobacter sp. HKCCD8768]NNV24175.1 carbonic anhydrase [Roseobacter sp. HKCCD8192]NNV28432.1 carbonic anhydrase [Roseobacter sp. HKCCD9061]
MHRVKALPSYLMSRYKGWKATTFVENRAWFRRLAVEGQRPRAMAIACCDSRVAVTSVFGQEIGEIFVHRNIANLVPPYTPDGEHHGTAAAIEYAVKVLKVAHILVLGHSNCGGVRGCIDMCSGAAPELEAQESFIGRWLDVLKVGYDRVSDIENPEMRQTALEKEGIQVSLENLMTYPFVMEAVDREELTLHGVWAELAEGDLEMFDGSVRRFVKS